MTIAELEARQSEIRGRLQEIDREHAGAQMPSESRSEWNGLNEEFDRNVNLITELIARRDRVAALGGDENGEGARHTESERSVPFQTQRPGVARGDDIYDLSTIRSSVSGPEEAVRELRDRAKRSIEQAVFAHEGARPDEVRSHLERLMQKVDSNGELSRQILATGGPMYRRAFGKVLQGKPLSNEEQRALSLTPADGGYAVPYTLDPTLIPTSNSVVNPLRAISRIEHIVGETWKGVTSGAVKASYSGEAEEAEDGSPTLTQPELSAQKAQAFVPYSLEIGADWGGMETEIAKLLAEAKDEVEAEKFGKGSGTKEPFGLLTGATTVVESESVGAFAVGDVYDTEEAVPPRFRPRAQWVANRSIYNLIRQFDVYGGAKLWVRDLTSGLDNRPNGNTGYDLLGAPANELSVMDSTVATGKLILVYGDFNQFLIVDRLGMTVEVVPHVFGASQRPTGQRGLYAYWRNSSKVLVANAFRVLKVK